MTFPTKDDLIEKMARNILDTAMYNESPSRRADLFESEKPYWTDCAKAALNALLESLPESFGKDVLENVCKGNEYYGKLLSYKD